MTLNASTVEDAALVNGLPLGLIELKNAAD